MTYYEICNQLNQAIIKYWNSMGWLSVVETLDPVSWIKLCSVPRSNGICDSFEDEKKTKSIWKRDLPGIIDLRKLFEFAGGSTRKQWKMNSLNMYFLSKMGDVPLLC